MGIPSGEEIEDMVRPAIRVFGCLTLLGLLGAFSAGILFALWILKGA